MLDVYRDDYIKQSQSLDAVIEKSEKEYFESWLKMNKDGMNTIKNHNTAFCYNRLNDYILQIQSANQLNESLSTAVLPKVNSDSDLVRHEISESGISGLVWHSKVLIAKLSDEMRKLEVISKRSSSEKPKGKAESFEAKQYTFNKPQPATGGEFAQNKLVLNSATEGILREKYDSLTKEIQALETDINVVKDQTNRLKRQYESIKSNQSSKAHETLLEIHKLRNDNRQNETNLACKRAQLLLFSPEWFKTRLSNGHAIMASPERRASESGDSIREMGVSSNGSINSKSHVFQEYNFIKPTFCDDCKGLLKGIMRQGLRCKVCKANVHHRCMESVSSCSGPASQEGRSGKKLFVRQMSVREIRNLPDKRKMLRRQKSTTDLDTRSLSDVKGTIREEPVDPIYHTIKCAASLSGSTSDMARRGSVSSTMSSGSPKGTPSKSKPQQASPANESNFLLAPDSPTRRSGTPKSAPHSPNQAGEESRRKILQSYGKSMSFDTEPSHKSSTNGRKSEPPPPIENNPPRHSSSASDVMNVRFTSTLPTRQKYSGRVISSSVKCCKDASTSPAPGREYVCLYDFEGMLRDDLSLKAGQKVRVAEDEGSDWWKGDCDGRFGYFPAFCVTFLQPWERVMIVVHSFKASNEKEDGLTLRKGQVVIQMSPEDNGWSQVRTGRKSGYYPFQYLEVFGKLK
ncbi:uncharacterized protein LOC121417133 isoform X2 [Lytechinus variegatus]|uniref:uncharacterized protein LOC121417133 isoform X2 n=1 Tax=Lytechinus variegatus TaxID=7654 RepID=UPI001BB1444E|nr:uncharacterized protein LOC121417133 isoform X2 [Lytechinus variegatus]